MDDKASSPCIKTRGTHRSRHSKSMDNTSLNHSDIFILMIGTYLSLHQVPGSIDNTTRTLLLRSHAQARYTTNGVIIKVGLTPNDAVRRHGRTHILTATRSTRAGHRGLPTAIATFLTPTGSRACTNQYSLPHKISAKIQI